MGASQERRRRNQPREPITTVARSAPHSCPTPTPPPRQPWFWRQGLRSGNANAVGTDQQEGVILAVGDLFSGAVWSANASEAHSAAWVAGASAIPPRVQPTGSKGPRRRLTRKPPSDGRSLVGAEPVERTVGRRATANGRFLVAIAPQTKGFDAFPGAGLPRIHPLEELKPAGVVFRHLPQPAGLGWITGRVARRDWGARLHGESGLHGEAAPSGGASRQGRVRLFRNFSTAATE